MYRETKRAMAGVNGEIPVYPGIDIDIPTGPELKRTNPEDVRNAVKAAYSAGAEGVILAQVFRNEAGQPGWRRRGDRRTGTGLMIHNRNGGAGCFDQKECWALWPLGVFAL